MAIELKLGDKLEALIEAVVPQPIIKAVKEKEGGCGCGARKAALNSLDDLFK